MNITNIETIPFYSNIEAIPRTNKEIPLGLYLLIPNIAHSNYILQNKQINNGGLYEIDLGKLDKENLDNQFSRGTSHICYVKNCCENKILFDIYFFAGNTETVDLKVLIDDESIKKVGNDYNDIKNNCIISLNNENYFIVQGFFDKDKKMIANRTSSVSILCENKNKLFGINIIFIKDSNLDDSYPQVTSIRTIKNKNAQKNYYLFKGNLVFTNKKEIISNINQKKFEKILSENTTYLETWRNYTKARGDKILKVAREFGKQNYSGVRKETKDNKTTFYINIKINKLIKELRIDEVVVYDNQNDIPIFLQDMSSDFFSYCEQKRDALKSKEKESKQYNEGIRCKIKSISDIELELEPVDDKSPELKNNGYIVMSMAGEETQIDRQEKAWNTIKEGRAGINHLNSLLEGNFDFIPNQTKQKKYKMSPRVKRKVFKNEPTPKQLEAIDIALQTPDIALIQGPPGTGKTTVIAAILEILNEVQDKRGVCSGRVLATSYQHDAVENMIKKIRINSLPTYKFGRRDNETYHAHIDEWCKEVEEKTLENNPDIKISDEEEKFYILLDMYMSFPTEDNKIKLLDYIINFSLPISTDLKAKASKIRFTNYNSSIRDSRNILKKAYSLRTKEKAFKDDGKKRIEDLYNLLYYTKYFNEHEDLETLFLGIINSNDSFNEEMLKTSKNIQEQLILDEQFNNKPLYIKEEVDDSIIKLCNEIQKFLEEHKNETNKKNLIISNWIKTLRAGSTAFISAIKDCDFVYSATIQLTEGKDIKKQKGFVELEKSEYLDRYDTVIIDEAARATPSDLIIPMCKAFKRIILVGDHRQLPQLVDENICKDAITITKEDMKNKKLSEKKEEFDFESAYKLSLFENLFNKLKDLEKKDGIRRIITLDQQFRTHKLLGEFASREFYENHPGEGYSSPRGPEEFQHNLPGIENKAAVWIDIPRSGEKNKEEYTQPSYKRECEVKAIISKLIKFTESQKDLPKKNKFSYGIITFYKSQKELIEQYLKKQKNEGKEFLTEFEIEVGTVDSFQGKEFDVVFLSLVRTNSTNSYGYLISPNRMCVSMTRQKKVLIVVGDKDFITTAIAKKTDSIKSLAKFYELCESSEYGVVL